MRKILRCLRIIEGELMEICYFTIVDFREMAEHHVINWKIQRKQRPKIKMIVILMENMIENTLKKSTQRIIRS